MKGVRRVCERFTEAGDDRDMSVGQRVSGDLTRREPDLIAIGSQLLVERRLQVIDERPDGNLLLARRIEV